MKSADVPAPAATTAPATAAWHRFDPNAALAALDTSAEGLTTAVAHERQVRWGRNELTDRGGRSALALLWAQISAVMVLILAAAAALSLVLGKLLEAGAIAAIVVLFAALGFVQEHRAERAIAALRRMSAPDVRVRRDGTLVALSAPELVPGDIVALEAGNVVPADLRLIEVASVRVQAAALTGESEPVDKVIEAIPGDGDVALGDRRNMAYAGTQVVFGRAVGVVVATGMSTELGRIATLLGGVAHETTPLQRRLDRVGKQLASVGVVVAAVVMALGAIAGEPFGDLVLTAISVAVAVIPEGLPAVVTVTLAIGAQRMLRRQALIRRLPAVETLGSVTVICSDKTGTLTQNRMTVTVVDVVGHRAQPGAEPVADSAAVRATLMAAALCTDAEVVHASPGEVRTIGDPTETALLVAARGAGVDFERLSAAVPRIGEVPFDSERKRMTTIHRLTDPAAMPELAAMMPAGHDLVVVKGAVDGLLARVSAVWDRDHRALCDDDLRRRVVQGNDALAADGVRVLAIAVRTVPEGTSGSISDLEQDLTLLGLVGMIDPPRPEVREAVARCASAGIRPVMITGDHPLTATSIARDLGIGGDGQALTGAQLEGLTADELRLATRTVSVFARVSPEHKLRIVEALKADGAVVAMTGDGVNDAPALRRADIGVAMGITGTDVSKEAADMVLRDDNFATIVAAVEEGRVIYDNLRRFVKFAVAGNLGKIVVMLGWPLLVLATGDTRDAVALLPLQLLWLNLMTDGLLGLAMGLEPAERNVMRRPPHDPGVGILAGEHGRQTAWVGILIGALALGVGVAYHELDQPQWQTVMFTTLAFTQVAQALATRSFTESLRRIGLRSNPTMVGVVTIVIGLQLLALFTPLNDLLDLRPLSPVDLVVSIAAALVLFAAVEIDKARRARRRLPTSEVLA